MGNASSLLWRHRSPRKPRSRYWMPSVRMTTNQYRIYCWRVILSCERFVRTEFRWISVKLTKWSELVNFLEYLFFHVNYYNYFIGSFFQYKMVICWAWTSEHIFWNRITMYILIIMIIPLQNPSTVMLGVCLLRSLIAWLPFVLHMNLQCDCE